MARTKSASTRAKPVESRLTTLRVLRRAQISPSFSRVTLGGGDVAGFVPMGFDQWFRLFLPVSEASLSRLPQKLDTLSYLRFLAIAKTDRPVLRNYTVRAFRALGMEGPEIDVDFVVHGSAAEGTSGPAASWAQSCETGDAVALLDEGVLYTPEPELSSRTELVADETGLPAAAGILASLDPAATGRAFLEIPTAADRQPLEAPPGVEVTWVVREDPSAVPGVAALAAASSAVPGREPGYHWVVGEQSLVAGMRRHWVRAGVPKNAISFTGYWKHSARH